MVAWMHNLSCINMGSREDSQLQHALISAIVEAIKHEPIRDVCLRDTHALYHHLACDTSVSGFAATLEIHGLDIHFKLKALLPLPEHNILWQGDFEVRGKGNLSNYYDKLQAHALTCAALTLL